MAKFREKEKEEKKTSRNISMLYAKHVKLERQK